MKLSCIIPCYGRPQRTLRAIECVVKQEFNEEWEAIFIGDGCPFFQKYIEDGTFDKYCKKYPQKLTFYNLDKNYKMWGAMARGEGIKRARGKYICFLDNDDEIRINHFENYYSFINSREDIDIAYFNSYIEPWNKERITYIGPDAVGHSEIIVKNEILKKEYVPIDKYGHDWELIKSLVDKGYKCRKCNNPPTYIIKGVCDDRETEID